MEPTAEMARRPANHGDGTAVMDRGQERRELGLERHGDAGVSRSSSWPPATTAAHDEPLAPRVEWRVRSVLGQGSGVQGGN